MIIVQYAIVLGYVFALIFGVGTFVNKVTNTEVSRKVIHILLFLVWIFIDLFFKNTIHQIVIPVIFIILNALSYKFKLYKSVEREEKNHLGTVYFAIAITAILTIAYFYPAFYIPSGIAVFCLTFGDGFAALVGKSMPSRIIKKDKSLAGFLAGILATFVSLFVFCKVYGIGLTLAGIVSIAVLGAILELVDYGLDNFTIVGGTYLLSYMLLNSYSSWLVFSILIAELIFSVVFLAKSITFGGALLSLIIVFSFAYFGKGFMLAFLLATYFTIFAISFYKKKILKITKKHDKRGFKQILINGGLGTLFVILYAFKQETGFLAVAVTAIGGCFIDSLSSDLGVLSKGKPYDFVKRQYVESGLSGGMSVLGTTAALLGSLAIGAAFGLYYGSFLTQALMIFGLCFLQTLIDSLMGSLLQVKYKCPKCNAVTEKALHCDVKTEYLSGIPWMTNNMVNLLSSLLVTAVAGLVFLM